MVVSRAFGSIGERIDVFPRATAARPRILAILPGFVPSTVITVVKPLVNLHRAGKVTARILLESQAGDDDIDWAEALVFCRNTAPRHAALLAAARSHGKPLIYDLDDNLFELPPQCDDLSGNREPDRQAMLEEYLRAAAMVRVYSQPLARRVAGLNSRVVQSFAPVDLTLMPTVLCERAPGPIRIVYATSRTQDPLCEIFRPALARILSRYGDRVEVHFWGCRVPQLAASNVHHHGLVCGYDRYLRRFSRAGYDIGLAPLPDDVFHRSKTNNKFREYGASGIAGVYSANDVYAHCVEHEVSGLLVANDTESWHAALERLIDDEPLRALIQRQARDYVREHYDQGKFEQVFLDQIYEVLSGTAVRQAMPPTRLPGVQCRRSVPGFLRRQAARALSSFDTVRRLGARQTWTALRWFISDRCFAARLRWQLSEDRHHYPPSQ